MDADLGDGLFLTSNPTVTEWQHGPIWERFIIPPSQITDFSSFPDKGLLGKIARARGFKKEAKWAVRSGKVHDALYFIIKHYEGVPPVGWFQVANSKDGPWKNVAFYEFDRRQADTIWRRISIEDGCPEKIANEGYNWLRLFGGLHMLFS